MKIIWDYYAMQLIRNNQITARPMIIPREEKVRVRNFERVSLPIRKEIIIEIDGVNIGCAQTRIARGNSSASPPQVNN